MTQALSVVLPGMPGADPRSGGNLPIELSSLIGRRREVGEVKRLLAESRLVTLTGVGGTGKTRLALRAAAELGRAFGDGVWFVDLTELHGPGLLAQQVQDPDVLAYLVAAALGLREQGGGSPLQWLAEQLADRRMLLVLDNCEHLIPASAILADRLLRVCPRLRVLATSREPLTIAGETLFPVPPLRAPDPAQPPSVADMSRCEAVVLFVARAQVAVPAFQLTEANHVAVAQLCHRLDGLPLAIELAAARVRVLAPEQILDRLADRFTLLSRGSRSAPERQQTLRACVDWSFELCSKPERMLWARLSVFVGGFELDAVEGICADDLLPTSELVDVLSGLVDKSILVRVEVDGGSGVQARYQMLETIRDYGREQLVGAGKQVIVRRSHRDWYERLVAQAEAEWISDRQAYWYARLIKEYPNLRAAVEFCLTEPREAEAALRILVSVPTLYWWSRGMFSEGLGWLDRALVQATAPTALRARALVRAAYLASWRDDADTVRRFLEEGQGLAHRLNDIPSLALAAFVGTNTALHRSDLTGRIEAVEMGLTILSTAPEPDLVLRLSLLLTLGGYAIVVRDHDRAGRTFQEVLESTEPRGEDMCRSTAIWGLGLVAWREDADAEAGKRAAEAIRIERKMGRHDRYITTLSVALLAWIAAGQRRYGRAAALLGVVDTLVTASGIPLPAMLVADHDACQRQTRDALGDAAFADAFRDGEASPLDRAIAYALDERRETRASSQPAANAGTPLTRRELQIADLVARGLSNREIAQSLVISQRTAESHLEHILTKLGFTRRAQVAAWIADLRAGTNNG
jgi:predicted ATPase/DNA-binding CsgD family transcriptional regulator